VGITHQVGPFVSACVSGVGNISTGGDVKVLSRPCRENSVLLPVADNIVGKSIPGCKCFSSAKGKFIESIGCQDLRDTEAGGTATALGIIRIFRNASFDTKITTSTFVQRLAPGIRDRVAEARTKLPHQRRLQRIVSRACPIVVPGFLRNGGGKGLTRRASRLPSREGSSDSRCAGVVVTTHIHTVRGGADVIH